MAADGTSIKLFYDGYKAVTTRFPKPGFIDPQFGAPHSYSFDLSDRIKPIPQTPPTLNLGKFMTNPLSPPGPPMLDLSMFSTQLNMAPSAPTIDLSAFMVTPSAPFTLPHLDLSVWARQSPLVDSMECVLPLTDWFAYPSRKPVRSGYFECQMYARIKMVGNPIIGCLYWRDDHWHIDAGMCIVAWRGLTERYTSLEVS